MRLFPILCATLLSVLSMSSSFAEEATKAATVQSPSGLNTSQSKDDTSKKDLSDLAFKQIEFEAHRLDRLISNAETVGGLLASFALAFTGFVTFLGFRSVSELKKELQLSVAALVETALRDHSTANTTFKELTENVKQAEERWANIQRSISNLEKFTSLSDSQYSDAQGAYRIADELSKKEQLTEDERKTALGFVLKVIELGEQGKVDPNLLFNCSSTASSLDFDYEALQLATLCAHWDAKASHLVRKHRLEDVFGIRFKLDNGKLHVTDEKPTVVRANAWSTLLGQVKSNPTYQCELVYFELHNMAMRNSESGYVDDAIKTIEQLTKENDEVPSYPYAILASFYAERGNACWDSDFSATVEAAVNKLSKESRGSSWYMHTIDSLMKVGIRLGRQAYVSEKLATAAIQAG